MAREAAKKTITRTIKRTSQGNGNIKRSSMNKHKKRSFKAYKGQGRS